MKRTPHKKMILGTAIVIVIAFLCCVLYLGFRAKRIPELEKIETISESFYDIYFASFDGEKFIFWYDSISSEETIKKSQQLLKDIASAKGREATDWSSDKVTYPVYSITINTIYPVDNYYGESVVWSNGYMILSSGKVYKCDFDFSDYLDAGVNVYDTQVEADADLFIGNRWFRSLQQAGFEWHPSYMKTSPYNESDMNSGVEAEVVSEEVDSGFISVRLHITNNTDKSWNYNKYPVCEVMLDGATYAVPFEPILSSSDGIYTLNESVSPGKDIKYSVMISREGMLPKGEYRLIIHGQIEGEDCYAVAKYVVD